MIISDGRDFRGPNHALLGVSHGPPSARNLTSSPRFSNCATLRRMSEDGRTLDEVCEINVTPMIDVLLSLLIIFMVAAPPPPTHKQTIALPKDAPIENPDDPSGTLLITIDDQGVVSLGENPIGNEHQAIVEALKASEKAQEDGRVAIDASEKLPYGKIIEVMSAAHEAGIPAVGVASRRL